ncbi:MAG: tetratricopeptide repeat protein [Polyangiaceae bacterium]|nr:tetratricopeptide repeat protein [Polyangiaceae bacterium]
MKQPPTIPGKFALVVLATLASACEGEPALLHEHLRRGDQALAEGRYAQAMSAYGHARELAPTSPRVQRAQMWTRVHIMADNPSHASAESLEDIAYEAQILLATENPTPARTAVCLAAQGNVLARRGDFDGARTKLGEAVKADSTSPIAHAALGTLLMGKREFAAEAKAELELALKHEPPSVAALLALGQIALGEGDTAGAAARFETALRSQDDPTIRTMLGKARLQQSRHDDAAVQFERATIADPKSADAWSGLGQALLGASRLEEAEQALRTAMSLRADESTAIAYGFTLARLKKSDQALSVFGQVLAQNPGAASALYGAGVSSEDLGRPNQALDYYRRVLALAAAGPQKPLIEELQKESKARLDALQSAATASAPPSASSAVVVAPPPRSR